MSRKKNKRLDDDEIIIGYNTGKKDKPSKYNKKKRNDKKKKKKRKGKFSNVLKIMLKIVIAIIVFTCIILVLFVSPVFNINEINVVGANELGESVYIAMSNIEIGENIFGVDKISAINEIKKEPYVESVHIKSIYPNKIEINVEERKVNYLAEENGKYYYIDKNGYLLESSLSILDFPIIKGYNTNLEELELGERINDEDLSKFDDIIKITEAIKSNNIDAKLTSIDITNAGYVLEFASENKTIMFGECSDLSVKMSWINLFFKEKKGEKGTVYLNSNDVYFSPYEE